MPFREERHDWTELIALWKSRSSNGLKKLEIRQKSESRNDCVNFKKPHNPVIWILLQLTDHEADYCPLGKLKQRDASLNQKLVPRWCGFARIR